MLWIYVSLTAGACAARMKVYVGRFGRKYDSAQSMLQINAASAATQKLCPFTRNRCATKRRSIDAQTIIWYLSRRLMKQPCCGERFAKTRSNRQHPPSERERSTVDFSNDVPTTRKRSIFNLDRTYRAGRGSKLNTFYCYEDEKESVPGLIVIRACLDGVLVVNLD